MQLDRLQQDTRRIRLSTGLGEDALGVIAANGREELGRLFEYRIDAFATSFEIDVDALLGHNMTLSFETNRADAPRHVNAFVAEAHWLGPRRRRPGLRLVARPWLWFLTLGSTCRIFHDQSIPDIIAAVLDEQGFGDYELRLNGDYPPLEYTVQYNESDYAFIARQMERAGIYYFFEHDNGSHKLILIDAMASHEAVEGYESVPFRTSETPGGLDEEVLLSWRPTKRVRPTRVFMRDFNFLRPAADLGVDAAIERGHGLASREIYEYPGRYVEASAGEGLARLRAEEAQVSHALAEGGGAVRGLEAGALFTLVDHPSEDENAEYLVLAHELSITAAGYESGQDMASERVECAFVAMKSEAAFRPARLTPWPRIVGPQTAMVTGRDGEEIDADEHARVKVRFHWLPEETSRWLRVSQPWVGTGFGAQSIPRIGDEVVVSFEDGDPDRPIVTGRVYNGTATPPYDPVAERTKTTFKTNSSKGGGGFNELRFEDKKGEEQIFIHAQKDYDERVLDCRRAYVGKDLSRTVEGDTFSKTVGESHHETAKSHYEKIGEDRHLTVGADNMRTVADTDHVDAGTDILLTAGSNVVVTGGATIHLTAGQNVAIEGSASISLAVGGSKIEIGPGGINIEGPTIGVKGSAKLDMTGGGQTMIGGGQVMLGMGTGMGGGAGGAAPGTAAAQATEPSPPAEADAAEAGAVTAPPAEHAHELTPDQIDSHPTARALREAQAAGTPFCEECARAMAAAGGEA